MADKTFIVSHSKARTPLTLQGKNLMEALNKAGLDPLIWKEVEPSDEIEDETSGENQGDGQSENH